MAKSKKKAIKKKSPAPTEMDRSILMRKFTDHSYNLNTTMAEPTDRMMRYAPRERVCPECDESPVVCMMRRPDHAAYRCRVCGYRWGIIRKG